MFTGNWSEGDFFSTTLTVHAPWRRTGECLHVGHPKHSVPSVLLHSERIVRKKLRVGHPFIVVQSEMVKMTLRWCLILTKYPVNS